MAVQVISLFLNGVVSVLVLTRQKPLGFGGDIAFGGDTTQNRLSKSGQKSSQRQKLKWQGRTGLIDKGAGWLFIYPYMNGI